VWFKVPNRTRVVGQDSEFANKLEVWKQRAAAAAVAPDPDTPPPKVFQPKHQLPPVQDYKSAQTAEFWSQFPHNYALAGKSTICPAKLRALAWSVGYRDLELLELVCRDLTDGADIGCRGQARNASVSTNAPSAFDFPEQITDAIADWIVAGFAAGPFSPDDRPANAKVNGIMCRQKPNGSARIILNLSAPKGDCVNDGIRSEEFPTTMSSTRKWLEVLDRAGRCCLIVKLDWASAYKHLAVRPEDVILQYFSWLGMDFAELCLVFGCRSSAGLYDRLAKLVLHIVILFSKFPAHMVCQYLDDVCAAAPEGSSSLHRFEKAYRDIAAHLGVQLAPTSDPDKAFRPTTNGVVLGVHYDTVSWTWHIPEEKLARLLQQIREIDGKTWVRQHELWSVVGRILHYAPLIPGGKFNISELISAHGSNQDRMEWVEVTAPVRRQLYFWWLMLKTTHRHTSIPLPERFPAWTFEFFTDASGGSMTSYGHGVGGIGGPFWFMVPWGYRINNGMRASDGKRLSRKLSALELLGPLICISAGRKYCRRWPVRVWVDNSGSIGVWKKGYSTRCPLCTTIVTAIGRIAAAIGCTFTVDKITRCSTTGAILADELSKGRFAAFRAKLPHSWVLNLEPAWIPPAILQWIHNPIVNPDLGDAILRDMQQRDGFL
jgi:hypothetical protein